jgi:hypothetical protein
MALHFGGLVGLEAWDNSRAKGCDILRLAYLVDVFLGSAKSSVHEIVGTFFAL